MAKFGKNKNNSDDQTNYLNIFGCPIIDHMNI